MPILEAFSRKVSRIPPLSPVQAEYEHHPEQDPFKMAKEEKIDYLQRLAEAIKPQEKIVHSIIYAAFMRQENTMLIVKAPMLITPFIILFL
jgi:hypothetical protein